MRAGDTVKIAAAVAIAVVEWAVVDALRWREETAVRISSRGHSVQSPLRFSGQMSSTKPRQQWDRMPWSRLSLDAASASNCTISFSSADSASYRGAARRREVRARRRVRVARARIFEKSFVLYSRQRSPTYCAHHQRAWGASQNLS